MPAAFKDAEFLGAGECAVDGVLIHLETEFQVILVATFIGKMQRVGHVAERDDVRAGDRIVTVQRVDEICGEPDFYLGKPHWLREIEYHSENHRACPGTGIDRSIPVIERGDVERFFGAAPVTAEGARMRARV